MAHHFPSDARWWRVVLDEAPDGMVLEDDGRVVYMNERYAKLLGYGRDEVVGMQITRMIAPYDLSRLMEYGRRRVRRAAAPTHYRFDAVGRNGQVVTLEASVGTIAVRGRTLIMTAVRVATAGPAERCANLEETMRAEGLSAREIEVMRLILEGRKLTEIAARLGIHAKTVSTHRFRLFAKLQVKTTRDLFELAARRRLVDWKGTG